MFGLFNKKKQKAQLEMKERASFFYGLCHDEMNAFIVTIREKDEVSEADLIKAAVNAKVFYELFRNVEKIGQSARDIAVEITGQVVNFLSENRNISEVEAGVVLSDEVNRVAEQLRSGLHVDMLLPGVKAAHKMTLLAGFDEQVNA